MALQELDPERNDPGGIGTDTRHVRPLHEPRLIAEPATQEVDLAGGYGHLEGFSSCDSPPNEVEGSVDKSGFAGVEERLVLEAPRRSQGKMSGSGHGVGIHPISRVRWES
jgi:hypothetical protein